MQTFKKGGGQGQVKLMEGGQVKRSKVHKEETCEDFQFHIKLLILHINIIKISLIFFLAWPVLLRVFKSKCTCLQNGLEKSF